MKVNDSPVFNLNMPLVTKDMKLFKYIRINKFQVSLFLIFAIVIYFSASLNHM